MCEQDHISSVQSQPLEAIVSPQLVRVLQIVVGVAGAVVNELWLKQTSLYGLIFGTCGALIGNSFNGPGQVSVASLEKLEQAQQRVRNTPPNGS
jgi:hypothetical protein